MKKKSILFKITSQIEGIEHVQFFLFSMQILFEKWIVSIHANIFCLICTDLQITFHSAERVMSFFIFGGLFLAIASKLLLFSLPYLPQTLLAKCKKGKTHKIAFSIKCNWEYKSMWSISMERHASAYSQQICIKNRNNWKRPIHAISEANLKRTLAI